MGDYNGYVYHLLFTWEMVKRPFGRFKGADGELIIFVNNL